MTWLTGSASQRSCGVYTFQLGCRAIIAGDLVRAEELAAAALELGQASGEPDAEPFFYLQSVDIARKQGTAAETLPVLEQLLAEWEVNSDDLEGTNPYMIKSGLAASYAVEGRLEDAGRLLADLRDIGFDVPMDFIWIYNLATYATAAIAVGDPGYAQPILERLAPYRGQQCYVDTVTHGPVSLTLGGLAAVAGRFAEAEE